MRQKKIRTIALCAAVIAACAAVGCSSDDSSLSKVQSDTSTETQTSADSVNSLQTDIISKQDQSPYDSSSEDDSSEAPKDIYKIMPMTMADIYYSGEEICPKMMVLDEEGQEIGEDAYEISYRDNVDPGTAYADILIKKDGQKFTQEFEIKPAPLDYPGSSAVPAKEVLDYTGSPLQQDITVTNFAGKVLEKDTDYTLSYENAAGPGTVKVIATGKGFYTGSTETSYVIRPQKVSGIKLTKAAERSVTLSWDKSAGAQGYQVCLKNSEGYFVMVDINTGVCAAEIGWLEPNTTYIFYIRPYLNSDGNTYYAAEDQGFRAATLKGAPDKVIVSDKNYSGGVITLRWNAVSGAEQYVVQKSTDGTDWKTFGKVTEAAFKDDLTESGKDYYYRVCAVTTVDGKELAGEYSEPAMVTAKEAEKPQQTVTPVQDPEKTESTAPKAYYFTAAETAYDTKGNVLGTVAAGSIYCAYPDPENADQLVIDFMYSKARVSAAHASERKASVMLETAAVGQMGGTIWGQSSCGPTAVAILADWQKGVSWNKDNLILYSEKNYLNDQGSLRGGGGMTAPMMLKLISGYSGGKLTARNIYGSGKTAQTLKEQIDKGNRSIIVCQYTNTVVTHYYSGTHFVVVCGYEYINGVLYFYYADPYYGAGGRSLLTVRADTLAASMDMVVREPKCIIVMD